MAKLNDVKTLDMVNGEITKVAYDGAEYARVADDFKDAQTGDLFLHTENGEYYEITIRDSYFCGINHPVRFITNGGRESGYMRECNIHPLFRKVSTDSPTTEQRVSTLEAEVSALKGEVKPETSETSKEILTFEGAEYRKVDRVAREGDVVVITHNDGELPIWYTVGRKYKVADGATIFDNDGDLQDVYSKSDGRTRETVDVYELVAGQAPKFAVGDYAKVVKSDRGKEGSIVQITHDSAGLRMRKKSGDVVDADCLGVAVGESQVYGFTTDQLVKATAEEIAAASKPKLKAGDFVKFKDCGGYYDITLGKAYEVFEDVYGDLSLIDDVGDEQSFPLDDEGCTYELVDAETVKWAKLGRKVGEYKKGDIVRVIKDVCAKPVGTIFEVKRGGTAAINCDEGYAYHTSEHIELIAPVDARFDK